MGQHYNYCWCAVRHASVPYCVTLPEPLPWGQHSNQPEAAPRRYNFIPRSCLWAMRSLFDLVVASVRPSNIWKAWVSGKLSSATWTNEDSSPSNLHQSRDEAARTSRVPGLARLLTLFVREAISTFESEKAGSMNASVSATQEREAERGTRASKGEPLTLRSKYLWAFWVLETLLSLERRDREKTGGLHECLDRGSASTEPDPAVGAENDDAGDDLNSILPEVASARSPQAFAAILRSAIGNDLDEGLQALAYSLCSCMFSLSRLGTPLFSGRSPVGHPDMEPAVGGATAVKSGVVRSVPPEEDGYELPSQEHALARAFSIRLRSEVRTSSLSSCLLQSQLELLAQWEFRRSDVNANGVLRAQSTQRRSEEGWNQEQLKVGVEKTSSPDVWINTPGKCTNRWDVATALFAGAEGEGDGFEGTHTKSSRAAARGRRVGTAESDASVLSTLPTPCLPENLFSADHNLLLVEAVSATSVTVSWGGWLESGDEPELQVGVDSDGLAYPLAFGKVPGASDLAQALRSKLKHAASLRQEEGPRLILKVREQRLGSRWFKCCPSLVSLITEAILGCGCTPKSSLLWKSVRLRAKKLAFISSTDRYVLAGCGAQSPFASLRSILAAVDASKCTASLPTRAMPSDWNDA